MTQKGDLFKGKQKKKSIPPSRHGKISTTRKGNSHHKTTQRQVYWTYICTNLNLILMCSWLLKGREWWSHRRWPKRWRLIRFASSIYWLFVCLFDSTIICCSSCKYELFVTTFLELLSMWYLVYLQRLFVSEYCIFSVKRVVRICLIGCGFDVSSLEK